MAFSTTACVTSKKSDAIRSDLKNAAVSDLKSANVDIKKIALKEITDQTVEKTVAVDNQYKNALSQLKANNLDSTDNLMAATTKYMQERERIKAELFSLADFYTKLMTKVDNGGLAITSLENMNQITEDAKKSILTDLVTKNLPTLISSLASSGTINKDFSSIITGALGNTTPAATPAK